MFVFLFVCFFPVLGTNKSRRGGGQGPGCTEGGQHNCHLKDIQAVKKFLQPFKKCGKVFHPLEAGILLQISVPTA